jgi:hypothetical protein
MLPEGVRDATAPLLKVSVLFDGIAFDCGCMVQPLHAP